MARQPNEPVGGAGGPEVEPPADPGAAVMPAGGTQAARPEPAEPDITRERTRTSVTFTSLIAGLVLLILLLVFILENTKSVQVSYFGASGRVSLGIALLLSAVAGALIVGLAGVARLVQLRRRIRRGRRGRRGSPSGRR
jgi:uncharacterized integral membrane protein